jgi:NADP-dependent 3-hydroxy acid dehydrogenase YdfG
MTSSIKQSVLITGCSKGGIGDALAQEFHSRGFLVFATARGLAKIQHLKDLGCEILVLDVTDEKLIEHGVEHVTKKTGGVLHYLINNAGMGKCQVHTSPLLSHHNLQFPHQNARKE